MTCIVGLVDDGVVYIGGDSAALHDYSVTIRSDAKVWTNEEFVFGFSDSYRAGQLIRYSMRIPAIGDDDLDRYMSTKFVDEMRRCLSHGGAMQIENSLEDGNSFLVGVRGRLFKIDRDFHVGESVDDFLAIGIGEQVAIGALFATETHTPDRRIRTALTAAERYCIGVRSPFVIEHTPSDATADTHLKIVHDPHTNPNQLC